MNDLDFIIRVLRSRDPFDCEELLWHFDEAGQVHFEAKCPDTFWWATADSEEITPANIEEFERSKSDATAACKFGSIYADMLFAARVRKMRPMKTAYSKQVELWPLFDACGPERSDDTTRRPTLEAVA